MKKRAVVLGCGMIGRTIARDLASDGHLAVTAIDLSDQNLRLVAQVAAVEPLQADLSSPARVCEVVSGFDVVLGAMPSRFGLQTLRAVLEAGKPYCDISFMPENALELDDLAKRKKVTAVVDCGVAPGLSNMIVGYVKGQMKGVQRVRIYVGGLPRVRRRPFEYKAPFAPSDVLEEYTRPARQVEAGEVVVMEALSEPEPVDFPEVGTLEAFNTDGLRSLLDLGGIPHLSEKTLRYPGHAALMQAFRETGLFDTTPVQFGRTEIAPLEFTSKLLFPKWRLEPGEPEFTVLRVTAEAAENERRTRWSFDLYDETDRATGTSSMARTTAFPCTVVARLLLEGRISQPGVVAPEALGADPVLFDHVLAELDRRGITLRREVGEAG